MATACALRRFVESHHAELMERFIREDMVWDLYDDEQEHDITAAASQLAPRGPVYPMWT